ncbi:hypothetical protein B0O99DRAFT_683258 [Bisporella sp. PMI_857]|nr:hypothetical protein B0O99DRAFT_683258 [Bisporella sp. PMI_857]
MSFPVLAGYSHDKPAFGHFEELGADFFDQFLDLSPAENLSSVESRVGSSSAELASNSTENLQPGWIDELWNPKRSSSNLGYGLYSETSGRAAISDSELLSLEGIGLDSPPDFILARHSLPSSPSQTTTTHSMKNRLVESVSKKIKRTQDCLEKLRSPIRKASSSPTASRKKSTSTDWEHKLATFDFEIGQSPSDTSIKASIDSAFVKVEHSNEQASTSGSRRLSEQTSVSYNTPISTPHLSTPNSRGTASQPGSSEHALLPPTPQDHRSTGWSRTQSNQNIYGSPSSYAAEGDTPIWWNHASTAPLAQPSPTALHFNPQRATKSLAFQLQNGLSHTPNERVFAPPQMPPRLMTQMSNNSSQPPFVVQSPPHRHQPRPQGGYFGPPQLHNYHSRRPHGPVHSRHSYPPNSAPRHGRTISDSESPSPKAHHVRKRKTLKREKISTPRTPTMGTVDFVNFTPSDSKKILTGVAPSGSSKTKARREKEAMEKRRKLSQAAVRAVRAAGGDIESLVEQGLLI